MTQADGSDVQSEYDAILVVSFGGPEGRDDVIPFLENVLRGKPVPRERMLEVAEHYYHFGGVSPINAQCRELIDALRQELLDHDIRLPIYWGNRNWHPLLEDTLAEMRDAGVKRTLAYMTSAFSSYSGCRQYRENIQAAQENVGENAPQVDKIRVFYNHPGFIEVCAERVSEALQQIDPAERARAHLVFTAHSIPESMSNNCDYVRQLQESSQLIADALGIPQERWELVYQSRSGRPQDPWLEPDILDYLQSLDRDAVQDVVIFPVGFLSDHLEVLFDLDHEARATCEELGLKMVRAACAGTHPRFITMIRELIEERLAGRTAQAIGTFGPSHDVCPVECCPPPRRPAARPN